MKLQALLFALVAIFACAAGVAGQGADTSRYPKPGPSTHGLSVPTKRFQQDRAVTPQIDGGAPINLGRAYLTPTPREGFTEVMITSVSLEQWLALAKAKQASFSVGASRFILPPTLLAAMRDFASRMAPAPAGS